jgi:hypothetical protein
MIYQATLQLYGFVSRSLENAIKKHKSFTSDDAAFLAAQTKNTQSLASTLPPDSEAELAERERAEGHIHGHASRLGKDVDVVRREVADGWKAMVRGVKNHLPRPTVP